MAFTDISGVTFADDRQSLLKCPVDYAGAYTVPQGVKKICNGAFKGCEKLDTLTLPISIVEIESNAFERCTKLTDIYYRGSLEQWLLNVKVMALAAVGYNLWLYDGQEYRKVENIILPETITEIRANAFYYCKSLKSVKFSSRLLKIGDSAFNKTNIGPSLDIPNTVISIGQYSFFNCNNIFTINLPESISFIGLMAFAFCTKLREFKVIGDNEHFSTNDKGTLLYDKFKTKLCAVAIGYRVYGSSAAFYLEKSCKYIEQGVFMGAKDIKIYLRTSLALT